MAPLSKSYSSIVAYVINFVLSTFFAVIIPNYTHNNNNTTTMKHKDDKKWLCV